MYLVIDIGGTFVKYALMDSGGEISYKDKSPVGKASLQEMLTGLYAIIDKQDLSDIKGIAISCPGTVDVSTGVIYHGGSFPFLHEVNLAQLIRDRYGKEVSIENDGKCAALAELWLGSVKHAQSSIVMVLGTAVGAGIIVDGKLMRGVNLSAGEVSYVMSHVNSITGEANFFGLDCSAVAMVQKIGEMKQLEDPSDGEAVFNMINAGDLEANQVFDEYCLMVAAQIMNLQYILDPELFAIGGGISAQPLLIERLQQAIEKIKRINPLHMAHPIITPCTFRSDANLYGALYNFFVEQEKMLRVKH
ncbi:ROK family transcriptional regulator [Paenibacillus sp. Root52]|uniref:ROK family protein n=1 Tax=Paenibacillus sp. Root52 TaxID=1736552 RepID=UPI0006F80DD0|nr:ROK family protein [Paenibacillus sp. Root52]KQY94351.1 ROK family transcriptional regulator [Paenibacillus sp. Root52]